MNLFSIEFLNLCRVGRILQLYISFLLEYCCLFIGILSQSTKSLIQLNGNEKNNILICKLSEFLSHLIKKICIYSISFVQHTIQDIF